MAETSANSTVSAESVDTTPGLWHHVGFWFPHVVAFGYTAIIASAIFIQFTAGELPCPLCILQRLAMMLIAIAAVWIIGLAKKGTLTEPAYARAFGLMLLGALLGMLISVRQVLLHIMPGDVGYGEPILGIHLYTWALITFFIVLLYAAVMLTVDKYTFPAVPAGSAALWISRIIVWLFIAMIALNLVLVFIEAGFNWVLPDDPTRYELLYDLGIKS